MSYALASMARGELRRPSDGLTQPLGPPEAPHADVPTHGTVQVLLSVFEPGESLQQQLQSIAAQDYPNVSLLARDDGSSNESRRVTKAYLSEHPGARLLEGEHLGAGQSFLTLLRACDPSARYAAFCDQDDQWLPGKLTAAITALEGLESPALYCAAVQLVDANLSPIQVHRRCVRGPSFENALVENVATGCTIVLNRPGIDLVSSRSPKSFVMHDAWCYLVISGCGTVVYDPTPQVLYRLHDTNTIGVATTIWAEWTGRARRHARLGHLHALTRQAEELQRLYGPDLTPGATNSLEQFLRSQSQLRRRLLYAVRGNTHFQRRFDSLAYRILYAAHRL